MQTLDVSHRFQSSTIQLNCEVGSAGIPLIEWTWLADLSWKHPFTQLNSFHWSYLIVVLDSTFVSEILFVRLILFARIAAPQLIRFDGCNAESLWNEQGQELDIKLVTWNNDMAQWNPTGFGNLFFIFCCCERMSLIFRIWDRFGRTYACHSIGLRRIL